jgi:hypothetical protein
LKNNDFHHDAEPEQRHPSTNHLLIDQGNYYEPFIVFLALPWLFIDENVHFAPINQISTNNETVSDQSIVLVT